MSGKKRKDGSPPRNDIQRTFVSSLLPFPNQDSNQLAEAYALAG